MKTNKYIILAAALWAAATGSTPLQAQTVDKNYILSRTMTNDAGTAHLEQINYFDGLGRPEQTVNKKGSPTGRDIVTHQEYDGYNRSTKTWLPVTTTATTGNYLDPATVTSRASSTYGDAGAFYRTNYENNPLSRVAEQYGPGKLWHDNSKAVKTNYLGNTTTTTDANLACALFQVSGTGTTTRLTRANWYAAAQLTATHITDEAGNQSYEFTDKTGKVLLQRQLGGTTRHDTYFVYDMRGNLCFVLPPILSNSLPASFTTLTTANQTLLDQYGYQYIYDTHNRCIASKLPGSEWSYFIYDKADRLILRQDGELRKQNKWHFTVPDKTGRVVVTGICSASYSHTNNPLTGVALATRSNNTNTLKGYTVTGVTLAPANQPAPQVLVANYYDDYKFMGTNGVPAITNADFKRDTVAGFGVPITSSDPSQYEYKGLLTGQLTATLNTSGVSTYLHKVMYYDIDNRLVQVKANSHLTGGVDKEYVAYNFTGQPTRRRLEHKATGKTTLTEDYVYTYDSGLRLTRTTHKLTRGTTAGTVTTIAENTYDELGRLKTTRPAARDNLKTTHTYNVRSWITKKASTPFTQELTYAYNGNVQTSKWTQGTTTANTYTFTYDNLSRITQAGYTGTGNYRTTYGYDMHGNITSLTHYGNTQVTTHGVIDNLTLTYTGNQLRNVTDSGPNVSLLTSGDFKDYTKGTGVEYTFNANGAMTKDLNKGIADIKYNCLNLPHTIDLKNTVAEARNTYLYAADGRKLKTTHQWNSNPSASAVAGSAVTASALNQTSTTDYVQNKVYENGTLSRVLIDGGYIEGTTYHFYITDHLGSTRTVANSSGTVIQQNKYYPFGAHFADNLQTEQEKQPYKYNGKELDNKRGLNLYDYHARQYDPAIGRFLTMDPLAEKYYSISPYAYCANNPVNFVDPTGTKIKVANNKSKAAENFAQIAATKTGQIVVDRLINSRETYTLKSVFARRSNIYNSNKNTINYEGDPWSNQLSNRDPAYYNSMLAMGHETFHAFDHDTNLFNSKNAAYKTNILEPRAVSFENYLRDVFSLSPYRSGYGLKTGNFFQFMSKQREKINNFQLLDKSDNNKNFGFSFTRTTTETPTNNAGRPIGDPVEIQENLYIMVNIDDDNLINYTLYNDETQYQEARGNW